MGGTKWLDTLWSGVLCSRGFSDVDASPLSLLFKVRMVGLMGGGRWGLSVIGGTGGGGTFVWWGGGEHQYNAKPFLCRKTTNEAIAKL